jgi:murein DD-endopeptidase MepM/ murein hydrolase activator NlpD
MKEGHRRYDWKSLLIIMRHYRPWKSALIFISLSTILGLGLYRILTERIDSLEDQLLRRENMKLKTELRILSDRMRAANDELQALIDKDDHNYRVILDTDPLSPEIRNGGIGGSERFDEAEIGKLPELMTTYSELANLQSKLDVEIQSYAQLNDLLKEKTRMWSSRPAIQPINNKQLDQLHMTYGTRLHPIFKVYKDHNGLDFSAPKGTPVYATGDGIVTRANTSSSYGRVIYLNHGHGYETRYAHLSRFAVRPGERIKRGHILGYVGNTGTSVSAHLHYEVLFNERNLNPINFFQRDLSNKEYERLIEIASTQNKALD